MFSKIMKLLQSLENPKYPSLGVVIRVMTFTGMWHPDLKPLKPRLKLVFFYIVIAFFFTQYFNCVFFFTSDSLKLILQHAPFHVGVLKSCFFMKDYKKWEDLIEFVSSTERKQTNERIAELDKIMSNYIRWSKCVTYFFFGLAFVSNIAIFTEPYHKNFTTENETVYLYIFEGYTSFDRDPPGYYFSMFIQTVCGYTMSLNIINWDLLTISLMIFFVGQLRITSLYCSRLIDATNVRNSQRNIAECHQFYTNLVLYHKKFNALISPVMFFYLIIISVNLGVMIIQIAELEDDLGALLSGCMYIFACLIQLLLFYWHGNEVIVESERVSYGVYNSDWVNVDYKLRRQVALFAIMTRKRLAFRAGPFSEVSLGTFLSILRRSYSFYTLLKETS